MPPDGLPIAVYRGHGGRVGKACRGSWSTGLRHEARHAATNGRPGVAIPVALFRGPQTATEVSSDLTGEPGALLGRPVVPGLLPTTPPDPAIAGARPPNCPLAGKPVRQDCAQRARTGQLDIWVIRRATALKRILAKMSAEFPGRDRSGGARTTIIPGALTWQRRHADNNQRGTNPT
jgi:hypothetical protein